MNILFAILLISLFVIIQGYSVSNFGSKVNLVELRNNKDRISMTTSRRSVVLPEKLIVGYANWNQCDEKIIESVRQGVNVVIWFSINLAVDNDGNPTITNGPDMHCVADIVKKIRDMNLETVHLISIGGWNSPHPDTTNPTENVYAMWNKWNTETIASPEKGFYGFDGFDWDIEGNDDFASQYNHFSCACLDFMGEFSCLAKQDGYIVSMAPAESYIDPTMGGFDRSLLHAYKEWEPIVPNFAYHGLNTYTYLLSKYGKYIDKCNEGSERDTFDFVTIQLYEGYSHAEYNTTKIGQPGTEYLISYLNSLWNGWNIDFSTDAELNYPVKAFMKLEIPRTVVGLANGWAGDGKFFLMYPDQIQEAYERLEKDGKAPRGFAYWNMLDEGRESPQRPNEPLWMAKGLNKFLKIRSAEE